MESHHLHRLVLRLRRALAPQAEEQRGLQVSAAVLVLSGEKQPPFPEIHRTRGERASTGTISPCNFLKAFVWLSITQSFVLCVIPQHRGDERMLRAGPAGQKPGKPQRITFSLCFSRTICHQGGIYFFLYHPGSNWHFPSSRVHWVFEKGHLRVALRLKTSFIPLSAGREVLGRDVRPGWDSSHPFCCLLVLPFLFNEATLGNLFATYSPRICG